MDKPLDGGRDAPVGPTCRTDSAHQACSGMATDPSLDGRATPLLPRDHGRRLYRVTLDRRRRRDPGFLRPDHRRLATRSRRHRPLPLHRSAAPAAHQCVAESDTRGTTARCRRIWRIGSVRETSTGSRRRWGCGRAFVGDRLEGASAPSDGG